jgi:hypothetical protein
MSGQVLPTLYPIVLEIPKLNISRDSLLWPSSSSQFTPEEYATAVAQDYGVADALIPKITGHLEAQINRWKAVWEGMLKLWQEQGKTPYLQVFSLEVDLDECVLRDRFQWDINNLANSPEKFAEELICDLGLKRTHEAAIAHAIRLNLFSAWEALLSGESVGEQELEGKAIRSDPNFEWAPRLVVKVKSEEAPTSAARYEQRQRKMLKENLNDDLEDEEELLGDEEEEDDDNGDDDDAVGGGDMDQLDEKGDEEIDSYNDEDE